MIGKNATMPPALAELARRTDYLKTEEVASEFRCLPQTILKAHSKNGHFLGIRPLKIGARLLWPVVEVWGVIQSVMFASHATAQGAT